jgi:hypothetical protein
MNERPCRFCLAAYPILFEDGDVTACEWEHRDDRRVYDLATAMAAVFQHRPPTDEQVCWFLGDADAVVDDFDPAPERWRVRKLPDDSSEFVSRFRVNGVTYVLQDGDKEKTTPVRLSTYRSRQREAEREARLADDRNRDREGARIPPAKGQQVYPHPETTRNA